METLLLVVTQHRCEPKLAQHRVKGSKPKNSYTLIQSTAINLKGCSVLTLIETTETINTRLPVIVYKHVKCTMCS